MASKTTQTHPVSGLLFRKTECFFFHQAAYKNGGFGRGPGPSGQVEIAKWTHTLQLQVLIGAQAQAGGQGGDHDVPHTQDGEEGRPGTVPHD